MSKRTIEQTVKHPTRRRLIEALWHSSEPLSPQRFHDEFTDGSQSLSCVVYHARILESDGVAILDREEASGGTVERFLVIGGPNGGEAVRLLGLA
jgi:hypothetical protein